MHADRKDDLTACYHTLLSPPKVNITIIEPTWDGLAHCPVNLGVIRIVRTAFPNASITFIAGERHISEIKKISGDHADNKLQFLNFDPQLDADTLPRNLLQTYKKIKKIPKTLLIDADLIIQTSCTASSLHCFNWLGLSPKTLTYLHGNANEIANWRSKNPLRRWLDFTAGLRKFAKQGGKVLVYEQGIQRQLKQKANWLDSSLHVLGHTLLEEERKLCKANRSLTNPIRIGFAGNATVSKGFPEFVKLSNDVQTKKPGAYEFHAFSNLHTSCKNIDQTSLSTPANRALPRVEFISGLDTMDFIFAWHSDDYYSLAASGILYDAINLGIPLIARRTEQIQHLEDQGMPVALHFDVLADAAHSLRSQTPQQQSYERLINGLNMARSTLTTAKLASDLRHILSI